MLCDLVVEKLSSNKIEQTRMMRMFDNHRIDRFIANVRASHKFVLTRDTIAMIESVRTGSLIGFLNALEYAKLPYPVTWVEMTVSERERTQADELRDACQINRLGFLLEDVQGKIHITMCYSARTGQNYEKDTVAINPWMYIFYFKMPEGFTKDYHSLCVKYGYRDSDGDVYKYQKDLGLRDYDSELLDSEIAKKIHNMFFGMPSSYLLGSMAELAKRLSQKERALQMSEWMADWSGETSVALLAMSLLNCKNAIETVPCESLDKINKKRRLLGKVLLCEYHTLQLKLSEEDKLKASESEDSDRQVRLHWRRGHFKKRKTGIYWWSHHMAGNKELGFVSKQYQLN